MLKSFQEELNTCPPASSTISNIPRTAKAYLVNHIEPSAGNFVQAHGTRSKNPQRPNLKKQRVQSTGGSIDRCRRLGCSDFYCLESIPAVLLVESWICFILLFCGMKGLVQNGVIIEV
ncbi:hypothetical protein Mapa_017067 [Marchantia paleacea]|nr:hypothetical protein Mapa_017067 [Marchantia paleacea]